MSDDPQAAGTGHHDAEPRDPATADVSDRQEAITATREKEVDPKSRNDAGDGPPEEAREEGAPHPAFDDPSVAPTESADASATAPAQGHPSVTDREDLTQDPGPNDARPTAVAVRLRFPGTVERFRHHGRPLRRHQQVVVQGERGLAVGTVLRDAGTPSSAGPQHRVLRVANAEDVRVMQRHRMREQEAFTFCQERIRAMRLPMKLIGVSLAHLGDRALFHFTSAERIDFRTLVKDLARQLHTRIEMRQIGVRDAARHTGGIGLCGRELCCATWLPAFKPISIRMAKDQNLSLNHEKLSGLCGRLRCCLEYEQETYSAKRRGLPKVGKRVLSPRGEGRVKDIDVLRRLVRVELMDGGYAQFDADEITRPSQHPTTGPRPVTETPAARSDATASSATAGDDARPPPDDDTGPRRRRRRRGRRKRKPGGADGGSPQGPPNRPSGVDRGSDPDKGSS